MEPRHSELRSLSHIRRGVGEKAKMLPPMRLPPFRGSDVMPETKLELFQDEILRHPLKLCEFDPSQVPHLAVAKEFLVGLADNDDAALVGNKCAVDKILRGRREGGL